MLVIKRIGLTAAAVIAVVALTVTAVSVSLVRADGSEELAGLTVLQSAQSN